MELPRIALGLGSVGGVGSAPELFGRGLSREQGLELIDAAVALGVTHLDTADAYGGGRSERAIGAWLRARRPGGPRVTLTTKVFHSVAGDPADRGLAPERIRRQLEGSLERLSVERVDLYLAHEPDPETPLERTLEAFDELVLDGKAGAYGLSNYGAEELARALELCDARGLARPALVQNSFSLLERGDERDVLPLCAAEGIAYQAHGPLAGGWLAGRYRRGEPFPPGSRMTQRPEGYRHLVDDRVFDGLEALEADAALRGVPMAALALAWLLGHPQVDSIVVGPGRPEQLEPVAVALGLRLDPEERERVRSLLP